jgi:hypothetical protein
MRGRPPSDHTTRSGGLIMYDILFLTLGLAGVAVCVGYVLLCEAL